MDFHDLEYGCVGAPLDGVKMRLKNWPEGGYSIRDTPYPRGEILVGGGGVARGYYKMPRQTEEAFFTDREGVRWFRTGDIGQIYPNGTIKVIDRLKDLVKLQNGEYISLGKVITNYFKSLSPFFVFLHQQKQFTDSLMELFLFFAIIR